MENFENHIPEIENTKEIGENQKNIENNNIQKTPEYEIQLAKIEAGKQIKNSQLKTAMDLSLFDIENPIIKDIKRFPNINFA